MGDCGMSQAQAIAPPAPPIKWLDETLEGIGGIEAAQLQLKILGFKPGDWASATVDEQPIKLWVRDDNFTALPQKKKLNENGIPLKNGSRFVWEDNFFKGDGYQYLLNQAKQGRNIFLRPAHLNGGSSSDDWQYTEVIFADQDDGTFEQQRTFINAIAIRCGLIPHLVVFSGSRSHHPYYRVIVRNDDERRELQRIINCLLFADPAIIDAPRKMRFAGFPRRDRNQSILSYSEHPDYTIDEIREKVKDLMPFGCSETRYKLFRQFKQKVKATGKIINSHGYEWTKILQCPEEELKPKVEYSFAKIDTSNALNNSTVIPLFEMLKNDDQETIKLGVGEGSRDTTAYHLAGKIVNINNSCERLGIKVTDDGLQILLQFGNNCNPQLPEYLLIDKYNRAIADHKPDKQIFSNDFLFGKAKKYLSRFAPEEWEKIKPVETETAEDKEKREQQKEQWIKEREAQHKLKWQAQKTFTPEITTNTEFFSYLVRSLPKQLSLFGEIPKDRIEIQKPENNSIFFGSADLGGGKSTWMKMVIEYLRTVSPGERWFSFGYINGLLLQQKECWHNSEIGSRKFKHLQNDKAFKDIHKEGQDLALCVHSLKHFADHLHVFNNCNIVIDEVVSVIKALLKDDNIKEEDRQTILDVFGEALQRANRVFCFDANISDAYVWHLTGVVSNKKVITVRNDFKRPKPKIEFLLGSNDLERQLNSVDAIKKNDNSPICKALISSPKFLLVSDSLTNLLKIEKLLKERGKTVLLVCSETNGQADVKAFLENPNKWITENWISKGIDGCVLISPTGGSGLDISVRNYFTDLYGLFFGVIDVDAITQMIGRLRDEKAKFHVWVKERGNIQNILGNFSKEIQRNVRSFVNHLQTIIWGDDYAGDPALELMNKFSNRLLQKSEDIHFKMSCVLLSQQLYEEWHLRECLQEILIKKGYELELVTLESAEDIKKQLKDKRDELYKQWSHDILNSPDLTDTEAQEIASNFFQSREQKNMLKKHYLRSRLPGIETTELWNADFIGDMLFRDPQFISQCELLYLLRNPELAKLKAQTKWAAAVERDSLRHFDIIKERYARVKALQAIGIDFFLNPENKWTNESLELVVASRTAKQPNNKVALPKAPGRDLIKWISNILSCLGHETSHQRLDSNDREYKLALKEGIEKRRSIILDCLSKHEKYADLEQKINNQKNRLKNGCNPDSESEKGDSTSYSLVLDKTGRKWSSKNQETPSKTETQKHGEDRGEDERTWGATTEGSRCVVTASLNWDEAENSQTG